MVGHLAASLIFQVMAIKSVSRHCQTPLLANPWLRSTKLGDVEQLTIDPRNTPSHRLPKNADKTKGYHLLIFAAGGVASFRSMDPCAVQVHPF